MVSARAVFYILSLSGFAVSFIMRTDINIAIVAMVKRPPTTNTDSRMHQNSSSYCSYPQSQNVSSSLNNTVLTDLKYEQGEFEWSPLEQSIILSSFFWTYTIFHLVAAQIGQYFGNKVTFGMGQLITAICSFLIPSAAGFHLYAVIALKLVQGIASSVTWSAVYSMMGPWIPPNERSRFMSAFQGMSIGIGLTYMIYGFIIAHFGWRTIFYVSGSIGVIWCIAWYYFAFNSPDVHPRINKEEKRHIKLSLKNEVSDFKGKKVVPWRTMLTSPPIWALWISNFGRTWIIFSVLTNGPTYMKTVHDFNIKANGFLSGMPYFVGFFTAIISGHIADVLITREILCITNVRKLFTAIGLVFPAIFLFLIAYLGCNIIPVLVLWFIAVALPPAAFAGGNNVDLAPNFSGYVSALGQSVSLPASFLSSLTVGFLTEGGSTLGAWRTFFGLGALIGFGTYVVYFIFGSGNVQPWNFPDQKDADSAETNLQPSHGTEEESVS